MNEKLLEIIKKNECQIVSIVGLAKNAGKTVSFNAIVSEAQEKNIKLGMVSYGRDGEDVDLITNKEKPRIFIPPGAIFVTVERIVAGSTFPLVKLETTKLDTVLGGIGIYQAGGKGGYLELVGINTLDGVQQVFDLLKDKVELLLLDGALDRKSLAVPYLVDGIVLATGAILGASPEIVLSKTKHELQKLSLPEIKDYSVKDKARDFVEHHKVGIIFKDGSLIQFPGATTFTAFENFTTKDSPPIEALVLSGALVDSFLTEYINIFPYQAIAGSKIIIRDGTRMFLSPTGYSLLKEYKIIVNVLKEIKVLAITVNPTNPEGRDLESTSLLKLFRKHIKDIPIVNVKAQEYCVEGDRLV